MVVGLGANSGVSSVQWVQEAGPVRTGFGTKGTVLGPLGTGAGPDSTGVCG